MTFKKVKVEEAVGMVLGHELTKIVPGSYKGPAFHKGHVITAEDISHLKDIGKEHIYLIELTDEQLHENDAAIRIAQAVCGTNVQYSVASEGRVNLIAQVGGLLKINPEAVAVINAAGHIAVSTKHSNIVVNPGDLLAAAKVVPLVIDKSIITEVEQQAKVYGEVIKVLPLANLKVAAIITGNEVYYGRIEDKYRQILTEKVQQYGAGLVETVYQPDDSEAITNTILDLKAKGMELIICAGGMSVDPDDVTPDAIRATGAQVVTYGSPVLPGAMFMLAYLDDDVPLLGMPACGMYSKTTVLDLVLPRILAGEKLIRQDIANLGYGGLCSNCKVCHYPHCPFGK
ncbi:molybdopterin-binding protein [Peptococcaceae bacterium 1198_IL3148]